MKKTAFTFLLSMTCLIGFSQPLDIDSLKQALTLAQQDKDKVMILSNLSRQYLDTHTDSALLLAQQALDLARNIHFTQGEARALFNVGLAYRILSDIPNSMRASLRGVQLAEENGFRQEAAMCNYNIGALYLDLLNDYPKALSYFRKARQWNLPVQDAVGEFRQLTLDINFGKVYEELNMPDSAEFYYNEALTHTAIAPDHRLVILNFKGLLQLKLKNHREALTFLRQAAAKKISHRASAEIYFNLASCFREMGQTDSCVFYAQNSLAEAEQIGYQQYKMKSATLLAQLYEAKNNPEALRFYKIAKLASDEVYGEQKVQELQRILTEEMQRQQETEREKAAYENRVRQLALLGGLAVVLLVAFLLYRNNRQKQKNNAQLQAQNRELEIEAALERVRSRTMAMHKSDELAEVVAVIYQEVGKLGLANWGCNLQILNEEEKTMEIWISEDLHDIMPKPYYFRDAKHLDILAVWDVWRNKIRQHTLSLKGESKKSYDDYVLTHTDFKLFPDEMKQGIRTFDEVHFNMAWMQYGFIVSVNTASALDKAQFDVLSRFATTFEQTYTRFLDLQKAEAQLREAQIEAALERVRSRALAMRHSDELSEAAELLYNEFLKMGVESYSCGYLINDDEKGEWKIWLTNPGEPFFKQFWTAHYEADHNLRARYESWKSKEEFHCAVLEGEENREHHVVISKYAPWKTAMLDSLPPRLVFNSAHFSLGHLLVISPDRLAPELEQAMVRFAKVFDLTYRRFLDLQKAEARTRETKIDAGLDRVRAEIASMRSTRDLERITPLVWRELTTLEVPFFRCGVFIMDEENERVHTYLSTPEGKSLAVMHLPFDSAETTRKTVEHWRNQKVYLDSWDKQKFIGWMQSLTEQGYLKEGKTYQGAEQPPEKLALHFVPFKQGMLYVGNSEKLSGEQIDLVQRLADTFAVAYARYEDFTKLEEAKRKVETTLTDLKAAQNQLIQSEKLASLGELTAGIAHEIQNPLNFVNNFSELSVDLAEELKLEIGKLEIPAKDMELVGEILSDLTSNQQKINHHGKRASSIVSGMLQHARTSTGRKEPTDLNALADEYLRLSYHGLRAKDSTFNAKMLTDFDLSIGKVEVVPQDIGRVFLNLLNNAFYATQQRQKDLTNFQNLSNLTAYEPTVSVSSKKTAGGVEFRIRDNGTGIPEAVKAKIFQPFFTTKPTGQGTGLGLSLAYDIVTKGHGGTLKVTTQEKQGTEFILHLPT